MCDKGNSEIQSISFNEMVPDKVILTAWFNLDQIDVEVLFDMFYSKKPKIDKESFRIFCNGVYWKIRKAPSLQISPLINQEVQLELERDIIS